MQDDSDRHPNPGHINGQQAYENPTFPGFWEELGELVDSKLTRISVHAHGTAFADVAAMASFVCRIQLHIKMTISRGLVRMKDTRLAIAFYRKQTSEERKMSDSKATVQAIVQALEVPIPGDRVDQLVTAWEQALAEAEAVRQTPTPMPTSEAYDAVWSDKK